MLSNHFQGFFYIEQGFHKIPLMWLMECKECFDLCEYFYISKLEQFVFTQDYSMYTLHQGDHGDMKDGPAPKAILIMVDPSLFLCNLPVHRYIQHFAWL